MSGLTSPPRRATKTSMMRKLKPRAIWNRVTNKGKKSGQQQQEPSSSSEATANPGGMWGDSSQTENSQSWPTWRPPSDSGSDTEAPEISHLPALSATDWPSRTPSRKSSIDSRWEIKTLKLIQPPKRDRYWDALFASHVYYLAVMPTADAMRILREAHAAAQILVWHFIRRFHPEEFEKHYKDGPHLVGFGMDEMQKIGGGFAWNRDFLRKLRNIMSHPQHDREPQGKGEGLCNAAYIDGLLAEIEDSAVVFPNFQDPGAHNYVPPGQVLEEEFTAMRTVPRLRQEIRQIYRGCLARVDQAAAAEPGREQVVVTERMPNGTVTSQLRDDDDPRGAVWAYEYQRLFDLLKYSNKSDFWREEIEQIPELQGALKMARVYHERLGIQIAKEEEARRAEENAEDEKRAKESLRYRVRRAFEVPTSRWGGLVKANRKFFDRGPDGRFRIFGRAVSVRAR